MWPERLRAMFHLFLSPALSEGRKKQLTSKIKKTISPRAEIISTEFCFNVALQRGSKLSDAEKMKLEWIIGAPFDHQGCLSDESLLACGSDGLVIEIGPRLNFSTPFSTNAVSICHSVSLLAIQRIECSWRYLIVANSNESGVGKPFSSDERQTIVDLLHDRMTECEYITRVTDFAPNVKTRGVETVDVMTNGRRALEDVNVSYGLAFDSWDLDYYTKLFSETIRRNPTTVECFDLAQSNSEHSRHWFFKGRMVIDGVEQEKSLMQMVMETQQHSAKNNILAFCDNSSGIEGYDVNVLRPCESSRPSKFESIDSIRRQVILTAETHNFPTAVSPFSGATTGTGGRIRDIQCAGRGSHVIAGTAGYSFGNLLIPGYDLPWEDQSFQYPQSFVPPLQVAVEASNGASDYGNKFGEPVICGFSRSFGLQISDGSRREYVKPIMFSGGIGSIDAGHVKKEEPQREMKVVKIGGPAYRIGVGGGAASSVIVQGTNEAELDFGAVQRGDAEMEQKMNRAIRACIEMGDKNPICSIHDQGAGGNGNVLKELVEPLGAVIRAGSFQLGDPTLSVLEIWGAEYQESNALLVRPKNGSLLREICEREKVPVCFVGTVTGDGRVVLECDGNDEVKTPVDLRLEWVLGSMPRKVFKLEKKAPPLTLLHFPESFTVQEALHRVLRLPSVASKRYLTNKVDRSVTGLIAQQQCVGPLHTPLADVAVVSLSHFNTVGAATSIGEQPIKGLVNSSAGARMAVGEALTNLVFALVSDLRHVKCSANWMWPAKLPGEGAALYEACQAMCEVLSSIGVAVDGGKDSLSMAAQVGGETVKSPGTLVISTYVTCPDVEATVTPDLKKSGGSCLVFVDLSGGKRRLGGSALAQVYNQIGDESPDLDNPQQFVRFFNTTQSLIRQNIILAGHDVSDGGLITCLLEMAFAGNICIAVNIPADISQSGTVPSLFSEELGIILEVSETNVSTVLEAYTAAEVSACVVGLTLLQSDHQISISVAGKLVLKDEMRRLRDIWEMTSFQLERLQCNPECVIQEETNLSKRKSPPYRLTFEPDIPPNVNKFISEKSKVAIMREEGSNGDREMAAAFHMAGFEVWDVNMNDLCSGKIQLHHFRGVAFVGGFSYADVFGSAKGWASTLLFNEIACQELDEFRRRKDTFGLGVCNGCQLMGLLGWVGIESENTKQPGVVFTHNVSERYESRFVTVKVQSSPAVLLRGMEGSVIGVWVAHGEGRAEFRSKSVLDSMQSNSLIPIVYVDDDGQPTMEYPLNPNGSPDGIGGLCSSDGRFLAIMPHPERTAIRWQWPWMPEEWKKRKTSPWLRMFQNAYLWCVEK